MDDPGWGHLDLPELLTTEGDQASADEYFLESYHERDGAIFDNMVREFERSASLRRWWPLVRQCVGAHRAGEYLITVPALLTVFEGYLFHGAPVPGVTTRATRLTAEKRTALEPGIDRLAWVSLDAFVAELWKWLEFDADRPSVINRHWVLHGRDPLAWGETDSLRLLQAIATLTMLLD